MSGSLARVAAKYRNWLLAAMVVFFTAFSFTALGDLHWLIQKQSNLRPVPLQYQHNSRVISTASTTPPPHQPLHLSPVYEPSMEHELVQRQVERDVQENKWFINDQVKQLLQKKRSKSNKVEVNANELKNILEEIQDRIRVTQYDLRQLKDVVGSRAWREREAAELSDLIQRRLYAIQHPPNCTTAKMVACKMERGCGIGCQLHHVLYCVMAAYGSQRTLVLYPGNWNKYFLPINSSCNSSHLTKISRWPATGLKGDIRVIEFPLWDKPVPAPDYMPLSLPRDIWRRLVRFHGDPGAWWVGQFFQYVLRPNQHLQDIIHNLTTTLDFQTPIVGSKQWPS